MSLRSARALLAVVAFASFACGETAEPTSESHKLGVRLAGATVAHLEQTLLLTAPYRCAAPRNPTAAPLAIAPELARVTIAVIAGLHELNVTTRATLTRLATSIEKANPTAVLSLGGHANSEQLLAALIEASASKTRPLIMVPGAQEGIPAHRDAIAKARSAGLEVVDGTQIRRIDIGPVRIVTLPGADTAVRLAAQAKGCVFSTTDVADAVALLAQADGVRVLAAAVPPRQNGQTATDLVDGIHIGSLTMRQHALAESSPVQLIVHGVTSAPTPAVHRLRTADLPLVIPAGNLDPILGERLSGDRRRPSALLLTITSKEVRVQSLFGTVP